MGLYKRGKYYWMTYSLPNGKRIRESTGATSKKQAEDAYAKRRADAVLGRFNETGNSMRSFGEMVDKYKACYTDARTYYCRARDVSIFKNIIRFLVRDQIDRKVSRKMKFAEIRPHIDRVKITYISHCIGEYEQWRKMEGAAPASIMKELGLLRRMFNVARKQWKWQIVNPVSEIELPKVRNERVRYLDKEELQRLFYTLRQDQYSWIRSLVIVSLFTGLRLTNTCQLKWSEVDLSNRSIRKEADQMKNQDYLGIPLSEVVFRALFNLAQDKKHPTYVFADQQGRIAYDRKVQRAFQKILKEAKIDNFHWHDLRHSFASTLSQAGVNLRDIAELLGHRDMRMTRRYAHLNLESLRNAVKKLDGTALPQIEQSVVEDEGNLIDISILNERSEE